MDIDSAENYEFGKIIRIDNKSSRSFSKHFHSEYGFGFIKRGAQKSLSCRGIIETFQDDIISVNPQEVHDGKPYGCEERIWSMIYLPVFLINDIAQDIFLCEMDYEFTNPYYRNQNLKNQIASFFMKFDNKDRLDFEAKEDLFAILSVLLNVKMQKISNRKHDINKAICAINDMPNYKFTLENLAKICDISRFQLIRSFKSQIGLSPHSYLLNQRIEYARSQLLNKNSNCEIAYKSGFSDQAHFIRSFCAKYGVTPEKYRRLII